MSADSVMSSSLHIVFVCTGNTCRSPMAEVIARQLADERGLTGIRVSSAGTSASAGSPASDESLLVAMERGLDLSMHRATLLSPELVASADLVLGLAPHHLDVAEALGGEGRSWLLTGYASNGRSALGISDPFGGDLALYRATFDEIEREVGAVLDRIATGRARPN